MRASIKVVRYKKESSEFLILHLHRWGWVKFVPQSFSIIRASVSNDNEEDFVIITMPNAPSFKYNSRQCGREKWNSFVLSRYKSFWNIRFSSVKLKVTADECNGVIVEWYWAKTSTADEVPDLSSPFWENKTSLLNIVVEWTEVTTSYEFPVARVCDYTDT
jgi:hypothetical protein